MNFGISVFVTLAHIASNLNSLKHEINDKEKIGFTKYSREKNSDPRSTHKKKFRNHEYPRGNFGPTKYPQEKKFGSTKQPGRHSGTMALNPRDT